MAPGVIASHESVATTQQRSPDDDDGAPEPASSRSDGIVTRQGALELDDNPLRPK